MGDEKMNFAVDPGEIIYNNSIDPREIIYNNSIHVYAAISNVMRDLTKTGIEKKQKNAQQNYMYRGIDDIYNVLSKFLSLNNLIIMPNILERQLIERKSSKGNDLFYICLCVEYHFISSIDGSMHKCVSYGEAMDSADKATGKALSAAYKSMAVQTFCIPTEGDNDIEAHDYVVMQAEITKEEESKILNFAREGKKQECWSEIQRLKIQEGHAIRVACREIFESLNKSEN